MKYLAIPSSDGLRLEEVNPTPKPVDEMYGWHSASSFDDPHSGWLIEGGEEAYYEALKKWESFVPCSFLTDDPRVVVGQQYPADEYETVWQYEYEGKWWDEHENERNYLNGTVRQILRRKAEGEKDRQRRGIIEIFEAENIWNIAREQFKNVPDDGLFPNHTDQDIWIKGFVDGYEYLLAHRGN